MRQIIYHSPQSQRIADAQTEAFNKLYFYLSILMHLICHSTTSQKEHAGLSNQIHDDRVFQQMIPILDMSFFWSTNWFRMTTPYPLFAHFKSRKYIELICQWSDSDRAQVINSRKSLLISFKWCFYWILLFTNLFTWHNVQFLYSLYHHLRYYQFWGGLNNYSMFVVLRFRKRQLWRRQTFTCVRPIKEQERTMPEKSPAPRMLKWDTYI